MPKTNTKDSVSDLEASASALSLEERRKQTLLEIQELRLEDELAELEETRNELLRKRELLNKSKLPSVDRSDDGNRNTEVRTQNIPNNIIILIPMKIFMLFT